MIGARQAIVGCMAVMLLFLGWETNARTARAEMASPAMLATFKAGTVTSVSTTSIVISGVSYRVRANAEIMDHKGIPVELAKVFVRSEAKFHLNKDSEIDMMVVMRPQ
jgi:hypothetical protein